MELEKQREKTILIVDDDFDVRDMLSQLLEDEGFRAFGAANGREALKCLRQGRARPCLILLDLMMPVMNGWEFMAERNRDSDLAQIPVVILSADRQLTSVDAAGHVRKPIELGTLFELLQRYAC